MKRLISICLLFVFAVSFAIADGIDLTAMTDDELIALRESINTELSRRQNETQDEIVVVDDSQGKLVYKRHWIENGNRLVIEYEYTNTTSSADSFWPSLWIDVFQDGIELDSAYGSYETRTPNIRPGYSYTVYQLCTLRNQTSPIEIEYSYFSRHFSMTLPEN